MKKVPDTTGPKSRDPTCLLVMEMSIPAVSSRLEINCYLAGYSILMANQIFDKSGIRSNVNSFVSGCSEQDAVT